MTNLECRNGDGEFGFLDLILLIRTYWKYFFICVLLSTAISLAYIFLAPSSYQAKAIVRLSGNAFLTVFFEPVSELTRKLKTDNFFSMNSIEKCDDSKYADHVLKNRVNIISTPYPGIVELNVSSSSKQQANECINAVILDVLLEQEEFERYFLDTVSKREAILSAEYNNSRNYSHKENLFRQIVDIKISLQEVSHATLLPPISIQEISNRERIRPLLIKFNIYGLILSISMLLIWRSISRSNLLKSVN